MTEKQYSSGKIQAEIYNKKIYEMTQELDKGLASFLLKLPLSMSYEVWQHLHKVKGDRMTENRFKRISVCGDWGIKDVQNDKVLFFGTNDEVNDTFEVLNELHDENKQLRGVIGENEAMIQSIYEELSKLRIIKKNLRNIKTQWNWIMESVDYD